MTSQVTVDRDKPEGAVCYGKCSGPFCDGEMAWLFNSDCDKEPWCEGCVEEAHARVSEALDAFHEPISDEELFEMDAEERANWAEEDEYNYF